MSRRSQDTAPGAIPIPDAVQYTRGMAKPAVAGADTGPPAIGQSPGRMAWYTAKLRTLVQRLEEVVAPPDEIVRSFWVQLDAVERARFSAEFPQCVAYVTGWEPTPLPGTLSGARE